jgi:hypothetical protein
MHALRPTFATNGLRKPGKFARLVKVPDTGKVCRSHSRQCLAKRCLRSIVLRFCR